MQSTVMALFPVMTSCVVMPVFPVMAVITVMAVFPVFPVMTASDYSDASVSVMAVFPDDSDGSVSIGSYIF